MKVNDPNLQGPSGLASTGVSKPTQTGRGGASQGPAPAGDGSDGVALSGLAQTLRSLETDSPERQAQVDALAQAYEQGRYKVSAEAVAGGIVNDALKQQ